MDQNVSSSVLKFADDTKLYDAVSNQTDSIAERLGHSYRMGFSLANAVQRQEM